MGVVNVLDIYLSNFGVVSKKSNDVKKILLSHSFTYLDKFSFFVSHRVANGF